MSKVMNDVNGMTDATEKAAIPSPFVRGQEARAEVRRHHPTRVLLVALDVGKDVHMLSLRTAADEEVLPPTKVPSLAAGYAFMRRQLQQALASGAYDLVLVGHEPTGVYHEAWSAQLAADFHAHRTGQAWPALRYRLLQPTLVKLKRQAHSHRIRKSDKLDVFAISDLLADGVGEPVIVLDETGWRLRHLARRLTHLYKAHKRLATHLLRTLDQMWPGALGNHQAYQRTHPDLPPLQHLVTSRPLSRERVRLLLRLGIDPYQLRSLGIDGIRQLYHAHGVRCGEQTAHHILAVAQKSLLPPQPWVALLAKQVQSDFARFCQQEVDIAQLETEMATLLPQTSGAILTTFPGLSPILAARYLAAIGDPARFQTAAQIWAFAGLDPNQADSGNRRHSGPISQRGAPQLRNTLYQLGFLATLHCPDCARLYHQVRQRGKPQPIAILHVAHKVNRILWRLLQTQQPYRSPLSPAAEAYWQAQMQQRRQKKKKRPTHS